ncbi:MAG: MFS transporter [Bacteroidales bacterium]|nr:MFS transporter [Bacteroidales bacterium]
MKNEKQIKMTHYRWVICSLLFFATTINYLDRQVLSLLQPLLAEEYSWSNLDYGYITSAFQVAYGIAVIFVGHFVDRIGIKKGYAWAIAIWSLGAAVHAFAIEIGGTLAPLLNFLGIALPVSVIGFMFSRIILAIGESGNFPAAIKTVGEWFPPKERSLATGIFNSGANIGAIIAPLVVPVIAYRWGWQWAFILVGIIGFIWLIFWLIFYNSPKIKLEKGFIDEQEFQYITKDAIEEQETKNKEEAEPTEKTPWLKLLQYRQTWSFFFGKFFTDGVWWFFLFWLPAYLKAKYDMEGAEIMWPLAILYTLTMVGSIGGGWFPSFFINKGLETYTARMRAMLIIAIFPLVVLLAQPLGHITYWIPVLLIGIGCSAHQAWSANIYSTVSDMFPNKAVASITGIGTMAGSLSGVIISLLAGYLFDYFDGKGSIETGYTIMFTYCAIAYMIAWICMKLLVPKYKLVKGL